jgi:hypothetical protein
MLVGWLAMANSNDLQMRLATTCKGDWQWRTTMADLNDGLQCPVVARNDGSQL